MLVLKALRSCKFVSLDQTKKHVMARSSKIHPPRQTVERLSKFSFGTLHNEPVLHSHPVYGDYPEILIEYYEWQVRELTRTLDGLTIYEDAFEIRAICKKIIVIRGRMMQLKLRFPA